MHLKLDFTQFTDSEHIIQKENLYNKIRSLLTCAIKDFDWILQKFAASHYMEQ